MWLYPQLWEFAMLSDSLAAVVRLVRASRSLSKDDFQAVLDPKHVYNIESARSSVTLDSLELLAGVLEVDPLTLLMLAATLERGISHEDLLKMLSKEIKQLNALGISAKWPSQFENGVLLPMPAGRRTPPEIIKSILKCKALGFTQKETSTKLGISTSTVNRLWKRTSID